MWAYLGRSIVSSELGYIYFFSAEEPILTDRVIRVITSLRFALYLID